MFVCLMGPRWRYNHYLLGPASLYFRNRHRQSSKKIHAGMVLAGIFMAKKEKVATYLPDFLKCGLPLYMQNVHPPPLPLGAVR